MNFKVLLTARAELDRDRAFEWYSANYSGQFAERWLEGVTRALMSLAKNPLGCPKAAESSRFVFDLRELLFGRKRNKHRILFEVVDDNVVVLHIRHSARRDLTADDF